MPAGSSEGSQAMRFREVPAAERAEPRRHHPQAGRGGAGDARRLRRGPRGPSRPRRRAPALRSEGGGGSPQNADPTTSTEARLAAAGRGWRLRHHGARKDGARRATRRGSIPPTSWPIPSSPATSAASTLRRTDLDPRAGGYDQGFYAYWNGEGPADNPHPPDSVDHLAWENGWSEALDEDFRRTGSGVAPGGG